MEWVFQHGADIVQILTAVVTVASLVANMTKTDADNAAVAYVSKIVNFLALNFKK